jgi:hypothetical protein
MRKEAKKMTKIRVDLHLHSTCSDGENTYAEVISLAKQQGMRMIAITDHNCFSITERMKIGDMDVIPGCEFSCTYWVPAWNRTTEIHVVGLFPKGVDVEEYNDIFSNISQGKIAYVKAILNFLQSMGMYISMEELYDYYRHQKKKYLGRHQIAELMIKKGYCDSITDAFDQYIGNFSPYYISATEYINYEKLAIVVKKIRKTGGIPILAHPFDYRMKIDEIIDLIKDFKEAAKDIGGIELYYERYLPNKDIMNFLKEISGKYDLLPSVGSDRHGKKQPFASERDTENIESMLKHLS